MQQEGSIDYTQSIVLIIEGPPLAQPTNSLDRKRETPADRANFAKYDLSFPMPGPIHRTI